MAKETKKTVSAEDKAKAKAEKFVGLANKRVGAALDKIRLIGNLSSKAQYAYTPEQVSKISKALSDACDETMARFAPGAKAPEGGFTL